MGYVGSLQMIGMEKGVSTLVQALADVDGAHLALVGGSAADGRQLRQEWIDLGMPEARFLDVGRAPPQDVPLYLRAFDVCAMPHPATTQFARYTSPLKLFEYMAAGSAIVASDLPGWADVLADGETAILAPPDDIAAWSVAIDSLRRDPELRRRLGSAARAQAMAHYTWAIRAQKILAHIASA